MWDRDYNGETQVVSYSKDSQHTSFRKLNEFDTFVRFGNGVNIIRKVNAKNEPKMSLMVSSRKPFGISTNVKSFNSGSLTLIRNSGKEKFPKKFVTSGKDIVLKWKVLTSKVSYDHAGQPNKEGMRRMLSRIIIAPPNTVCTETYLVVGSFDSQRECCNLANYLQLRLPRFLLVQKSYSHNITKDTFSFVPQLDWNKSYSDADLYKRYKLSSDEIRYVENTIMEMDQ